MKAQWKTIVPGIAAGVAHSDSMPRPDVRRPDYHPGRAGSIIPRAGQLALRATEVA